MAKIKKINQKLEDGSFASYDIGVNAANVDMNNESNLEDTITELKNSIVIVNPNLLLNSTGNLNSLNYWFLSQYTLNTELIGTMSLEKDEFTGRNAIEIQAKGTHTAYCTLDIDLVNAIYQIKKLSTKGKITISGRVFSYDSNQISAGIEYRTRKGKGNIGNANESVRKTLPVDSPNVWNDFSFTVDSNIYSSATVENKVITAYLKFYCPDGGHFLLSSLKVELSDLATPWCPAEKDLNFVPTNINLLTHTNDFSEDWGTSWSREEKNGFITSYKSDPSTDSFTYLLKNNLARKLETNKFYTLSFYACSDETNELSIIFGYYNKVFALPRVLNDTAIKIGITNKINRYCITYFIDEDVSSVNINTYFTNKSDAKIQIWGIKLEEGDRATGWCPAPSDY